MHTPNYTCACWKSTDYANSEIMKMNCTFLVVIWWWLDTTQCWERGKFSGKRIESSFQIKSASHGNVLSELRWGCAGKKIFHPSFSLFSWSIIFVRSLRWGTMIWYIAKPFVWRLFAADYRGRMVMLPRAPLKIAAYLNVTHALNTWESALGNMIWMRSWFGNAKTIFKCRRSI
jgi:hypothetical protein